MRTKLTDTTSAPAIGYATSRKLFKVPAGPYRGRMIALFKSDPATIVYKWADRPYTSWSEPVTVAADSAALPCDAAMSATGDIHLVYTSTATDNIASVRLSFTDGAWQVGARVDVYDTLEGLNPSIAIGIDGKIWLAWLNNTSNGYRIQLKCSTDSGATWGTGLTDPGELLAAELTEAYPKLILAPNEAHVIFAADSNLLRIQSRPIDGGSWSTPFTIATETGLDHDFDAAVSDDGLVGLVYGKNTLNYREFDGSNWGPATQLDNSPSSCRQLTFVNNAPAVIYSTEFADGQHQVQYVRRDGLLFSEPAPFVSGAACLDSLILYESLSSNHADLTTAASAAATGDIFHPESGAVVANPGDALYAGMDERFRYLRFILSAPGSGGTIAISYWNGSYWVGFTPTGGEYDIDSVDRELLLWPDLNSAPSDWQKREIDGVTRYWIRMEVVSGFTVYPVASQITAMSDISELCLRR